MSILILFLESLLLGSQVLTLSTLIQRYLFTLKISKIKRDTILLIAKEV
jgi:hypothetical protein